MVLMTQKNSELKPNDVKVGSKEEAYWTQIKDRTLVEIEQLEKMLKFNKAILEMCEQKIKAEKKA